jgi:hypothetical protein
MTRWILSLAMLSALPLGAQQDKCLDAANESQKKWTAAGPHSWLDDVWHNEAVEIARTWCYVWETHGMDRLDKGIDFGRAFFTGDGWHPVVGGIVPGSGFAGGLGMQLERNTAAPALRYSGSVEARGSYNGFWVAGGVLDITRADNDPDNRHIHAVIEAREYELPQLTYFGLGNASLLANESLYGLQATTAGAHVDFPLPGGVSLIAGVGGLVADPAPAHGSLPSIEQKFTAADTPGLTTGTGYVVPGAGIKWRYPEAETMWGYSTSLAASFRAFHEASGLPYSFRRIDFTWQNVFRPYVRVKPAAAKAGPPRKVGLGAVSATFRLAESWGPAGNNVPFYLQPTIGGTDIDNIDVVRSYRDYRFRAPNAMAFQAEYERSIKGPIGLLGFYDVGKVGMARGDLDFTHMRHSFGAGIVVTAGNLPVLKFYYAWGGHEGTHTTYTLNTNNFAGTASGVF